jgi:drug/metabolite transporter (DMT)-like permease
METSYRRNISKGIIYTIVSSLGFALMTFCVKGAGDLPTMEKAFFRNAVAAVIASVTIMRMPGPGRFKTKKETRVGLLLRALFGTLGMIANFWAIDRLGLADSNILNKMSPFFTIIASVFLLKEKPTKLDNALVALAFAGTIFVIKPSGGMAAIPALVGLFSGFSAGMAYAFLRLITNKGERSTVVVFYFSFLSCLSCIPFILADFKMPTMHQFLWLIGTGASAAVGQFGVTAAYKYAPAKDVSVFNYSQVLFSALLGFLYFHEVPDLLSWTGYIIIIGAAALKWKNESSFIRAQKEERKKRQLNKINGQKKNQQEK